MHPLLVDPVGPGAPASASRAQVVRALRQSADGLAIRDVAAQVGLHPNTVRFHLERLVAEGAVERTTATNGGRGRPRAIYTVVSQPGTREDPRSYRLLAEILAGVVASTQDAPAEAARRAGSAWGRYLTDEPAPHRRTGAADAVDNLGRLLDDVGFDPEIDRVEPAEATEVRLRHCPFLEVATTHPEVVCSVHLGLMQGALAAMRAPVTTTRLTPFVEPTLCLARLGPAPSDG